MAPLLSILLLASMSVTASPCQEDERYRQFDFWLGSWDVYNAKHELVGTNDITAAEDGCALIERWNGREGSTGTSINYFDPSRGTWKQAWVAASGGVIELEGRLEKGSMVMEGTLVKVDGSRTRIRGRWTALDDGRVRQEFHLPDSTNAWQSSFDGYYERTDDRP